MCCVTVVSFLFILTLHARWHPLKQTFFLSLPSPQEGYSMRDSWPVRSSKFRFGLGSVKSAPGVGYWILVWVFYWVCLGNNSHDLMGTLRVGLSSLVTCCIFSMRAWLLGSEHLLFFMHNKSSIIENQFTSSVLFACTLLWGHASKAAGGSRIVDQNAADSLWRGWFRVLITFLLGF
jgi:hypothetical protein